MRTKDLDASCKGMVTGPLHPVIVHFITFMAIALI